MAFLIDDDSVKCVFPLRFRGCACHVAYPDQLHTFVGDCGSGSQVVALVPAGDVRFTSNRLGGMCIIAVVGERVSTDYLDFLEQMQISYVFAGADGGDLRMMRERLSHDFGITDVRAYNIDDRN